MTWKEVKDKLEKEYNVKDDDSIVYIDFHTWDIDHVVIDKNEDGELMIWR